MSQNVNSQPATSDDGKWYVTKLERKTEHAVLDQLPLNRFPILILRSHYAVKIHRTPRTESLPTVRLISNSSGRGKAALHNLEISHQPVSSTITATLTTKASQIRKRWTLFVDDQVVLQDIVGVAAPHIFISWIWQCHANKNPDPNFNSALWDEHKNNTNLWKQLVASVVKWSLTKSSQLSQSIQSDLRSNLLLALPSFRIRSLTFNTPTPTAQPLRKNRPIPGHTLSRSIDQSDLPIREDSFTETKIKSPLGSSPVTQSPLPNAQTAFNALQRTIHSYQPGTTKACVWRVVSLGRRTKHRVLDQLPLERFPILVPHSLYSVKIEGVPGTHQPTVRLISHGRGQNGLTRNEVNVLYSPLKTTITTTLVAHEIRSRKRWALFVNDQLVLQNIRVLASPRIFVSWVWNRHMHRNAHPDLNADLRHEHESNTKLWQRLVAAVTRWARTSHSSLAQSIQNDLHSNPQLATCSLEIFSLISSDSAPSEETDSTPLVPAASSTLSPKADHTPEASIQAPVQRTSAGETQPGNSKKTKVVQEQAASAPRILSSVFTRTNPQLTLPQGKKRKILSLNMTSTGDCKRQCTSSHAPPLTTNLSDPPISEYYITEAEMRTLLQSKPEQLC